ncbi:hypothetical protein H4R99_004529 [Coemansia sp. RSA 1722]|nr:hypothetical protein H4R99_004529 [Coemansia sp. RSA 1722]
MHNDGNNVGSTSENSETAGNAKKPQPKQHKYREYVCCHGLLRCTNKDCLKTTPGYEDTQRRRLWNRDMAAVLNFRKILMAHRMGKERPEHLQRPQSKDKASDPAAAKPKRTRKKAAAAPAILLQARPDHASALGDDAQLLLQRLLLNN